MSKRILILNSISGLAVLATNVVVAFIMSPILIHGLGNRNYGIWELLAALVGYLGILELGIGPAIVRYVAVARSRKDRDYLGRIFNTGVFGLAGFGLIGLMILLVVASWPEYVFIVLEDPEAGELTSVIVVFALNIAAYLPRTAISAYLLGLQAHRIVNMIQIAVTIVQSFIIYLVLTSNWTQPLIWLALIMFGGTVLQGVLLLIWSLLIDRRVKVEISSFSLATMKELLRYGVTATLITASSGTLTKLISYAVAFTAGVGHVVYYVVPNRLVEYARAIGTELGIPLTPYFSDLIGKGDIAGARVAWLRSTRILQIVLLFVPLAIMTLGEPFIRRWIGGEYANLGKWVLYILSLGLFLQGIVANGARVLYSLNKHGPLALYTSIFAPVVFGLSIGFGLLWGLGGVAAAITIYAIGASIFELNLTCRALAVGLSEYVRSTVLRFTTPLIIAGGILTGLRGIIYPASYTEIVLQGVIGFVGYFVTVWFITLDERDKQLLLTVVRTLGRTRTKNPA